MSEKSYIIGIDNGGTLTKACVYDRHGNMVATSGHRIPTTTPKPLWTERDTEALWQANVAAIRGCLEAADISADQVACVSLTGHGNGVYLCRADGTPTRAGIISTDGRAFEEAGRWMSDPDYDSSARAKTFSDTWAGQPNTLLAWLDEHEPDVFDQTDYVFMCKDYVRFRLTGEARSDISDASFISMMDIPHRSYDRDLLAYWGIERWFDKLPPLVESTDIAGYITADVAALTGLPEGTPVAGGVADVAAAALASGLVESDKLTVVTGTWSINEFVTTDPAGTERPWLTAVYPVPGTFLVMDASPNGVSNLEWFLKIIGQVMADFGSQRPSDADTFATCEKMIKGITPSIEDPFFVPFINGTEVVPRGLASFIGLNSYHGIGHLVRAVYEGVIFMHLYHLKNLRTYDGLKDEIIFTGGASNSEMWTQMFSDAFNAPLEVVDAQEAGTLGTAVIGAVAAGVWPDIQTAVKNMTKAPRLRVEPNPEFTQLWQQRFARFEQYLQTQR